MPTIGPVPAATMRSGKTTCGPFVVTRTGRIACTFAPGRSFSARKLNFSRTYCAMTGFTFSGIENLLSVSHLLRASASFDWSCTVAYGPTFSCLVTVTPPAEPLSAPLARGASAARSSPELQLGAAGQFRGGATTLTEVNPPMTPKSVSAERPTVASPEMGSTHANS
jgi:hypothetical protein